MCSLRERSSCPADALWDAQQAAEQKKLHEVKQEAVAKASSCLECGLAEGDDPAKDVLWISCDTCHNWYHGSCAEVTQDMMDLAAENESWECQECWLKRYPKLLVMVSACGRSSHSHPCCLSLFLETQLFIWGIVKIEGATTFKLSSRLEVASWCEGLNPGGWQQLSRCLWTFLISL